MLAHAPMLVYLWSCKRVQLAYRSADVQELQLLMSAMTVVTAAWRIALWAMLFEAGC